MARDKAEISFVSVCACMFSLLVWCICIQVANAHDTLLFMGSLQSTHKYMHMHTNKHIHIRMHTKHCGSARAKAPVNGYAIEHT
jgi:hypothetical protein